MDRKYLYGVKLLFSFTFNTMFFIKEKVTVMDDIFLKKLLGHAKNKIRDEVSRLKRQMNVIEDSTGFDKAFTILSGKGMQSCMADIRKQMSAASSYSLIETTRHLTCWQPALREKLSKHCMTIKRGSFFCMAYYYMTGYLYGVKFTGAYLYNRQKGEIPLREWFQNAQTLSFEPGRQEKFMKTLYQTLEYHFTQTEQCISTLPCNGRVNITANSLKEELEGLCLHFFQAGLTDGFVNAGYCIYLYHQPENVPGAIPWGQGKETFGKRLIKLRKCRKLTQKNISDYLHYSYTTICNYESDRNMPPYPVLIKLAKLLQVSVDYLICATDIPNPYWIGGDGECSALDPDLYLMQERFCGLSVQGKSIILKMADCLLEYTEEKEGVK